MVWFMNSFTETISNDYFSTTGQKLAVVGWEGNTMSSNSSNCTSHIYAYWLGFVDSCKYIILDNRSELRWHPAITHPFHPLSRAFQLRALTVATGVSSFLKIHRLGSHQLWNFSFRKHTNCSCTQNRLYTDLYVAGERAHMPNQQAIAHHCM